MVWAEQRHGVRQYPEDIPQVYVEANMILWACFLFFFFHVWANKFSLCVYMHVHLCPCVCVCVCACMCACVCAWVYVCVWVCICVCVCICVYVCVYTACICVCMCVYMCVCIHSSAIMITEKHTVSCLLNGDAGKSVVQFLAHKLGTWRWRAQYMLTALTTEFCRHG